MKQPLYITATAICSAIGHGVDNTMESLRQENSGLAPCEFAYIDIDTFTGRVDGVEQQPLPEELKDYLCRNNQLALMTMQQQELQDRVGAVRERYGADRVGVFMGTSTSGILSTELAYQNLDDNGELPEWFRYAETYNFFSLTDFVSRYFALGGPALTISTACSSSAKVFATASRYIDAGLCDAAIVGGVDSLCGMTLYGFSSLELVSGQPCRPADRDRNGLSIGEAAGFAVVETDAEKSPDRIALLGYGESSDAYHMSTPHPQGEGAILAMKASLQMAGLEPGDIDYINLHGTATPNNDRVEDVAVTTVFGEQTPCSSTKGWTGHTLGAAGIVEAIISMLCIQQNFLPRSLNTAEKDPEFRSNIILVQEQREVRYALSNSFGFGGNNCALLFGGESS